LLDDYRDYLRARDLRIWNKNSKEAQYVRKLGLNQLKTSTDPNYGHRLKGCDTPENNV
jgi:hypothetical protein